MIDKVFGVMMMLVAVGVVCILAYLTTIIIAKKSNTLQKNTSVKVLERSSIGVQTAITIIQVKNKVYLLINQGKQVTVLDAIDIEEWYESPRFVPQMEEYKGHVIPKSIEEVFKKFKGFELNSSHRKGNGGNTDEE